MKTKLRKAAIVLGVLLVAFVVLMWVAHLRSKGPVEAYKEQLRAAGEKLTIDALIPPHVPTEQNSVEIFRQAVGPLRAWPSFLDTNPPPAMRMVAPGKAAIGWTLPDIRSGDVTNMWEDADVDLGLRYESLKLLQEIIEHPVINFEFDYHLGPNLPLQDIVQMRRASQLLSAATVHGLHRGDLALAVTNARAMLALVKSSENEPLLISQLVRISIAQSALTAHWEVLQSPGVTDEQLATMQRDWSELEFIRAAEKALAMERASTEMIAERLRNSAGPSSTLDSYYGGSSSSSGSSGNWFDDLPELPEKIWRGTKRTTRETFWRVSWSYTDELRALKGEQLLLDAVRQVKTNGFFADALQEQKRKLVALGFDNLPGSPGFLTDPGEIDLRSVLSELMSSSAAFLNRVLTMETAKQMAITAIALKRYQLINGNYPASLAALVPQFLPAVPRDPADGNPLRYQQTGKTFLLYSIGDNFVDDGGDPTPANSLPSFAWQRGRDWVWPQPPSLQDLQDYYKTNAVSLLWSHKKILEQTIEQMTRMLESAQTNSSSGPEK